MCCCLLLVVVVVVVVIDDDVVLAVVVVVGGGVGVGAAPAVFFLGFVVAENRQIGEVFTWFLQLAEQKTS